MGAVFGQSLVPHSDRMRSAGRDGYGLRPTSAGRGAGSRLSSAGSLGRLRRSTQNAISVGSLPRPASALARPGSALHSQAALPLAQSRAAVTMRPRSAICASSTPAQTAEFFAERAQFRLATDDVGAETAALAMADFDRAVAIKPTSFRVRYARALALARNNELGAALADLDAAVNAIHVPHAQHAPADAIALERAAVYLARGYARQDAGRQVDALADFDAALRFAPAVPEQHIARATCLRKLGRFAEAIDGYTAARCLEQPERFADFQERHRIVTLTAEKLSLIHI